MPANEKSNEIISQTKAISSYNGTNHLCLPVLRYGMTSSYEEW